MIKLKKKKGTYKKASLKKRKGRRRAAVMLRARRALAYGGLLVFVLWAGAWIFLSDIPDKAHQWAVQKTLAVSAAAGFTVQDILVEGRIHTDPAILRAIINIQAGDPIFALNPQEARPLIEQISWVKSARVERRLPGTVYIEITERKPLALWKRGEELSVIDREGEILTSRNPERFEDLIIISGGRSAAKKAAGLLDLLRAEPDVLERITAAVWTGGRRWDLQTRQGVLVKLPQEDTGLAITRLAGAQRKGGLLDKNLTHIDLRDKERIIVKTRPGQVQTYQASVKSKNSI